MYILVGRYLNYPPVNSCKFYYKALMLTKTICVLNHEENIPCVGNFGWWQTFLALHDCRVSVPARVDETDGFIDNISPPVCSIKPN